VEYFSKGREQYAVAVMTSQANPLMGLRTSWPSSKPSEQSCQAARLVRSLVRGNGNKGVSYMERAAADCIRHSLVWAHTRGLSSPGRAPEVAIRWHFEVS